MLNRKLHLILLLVLFGAPLTSAQTKQPSDSSAVTVHYAAILNDVPQQIDKKARYLFYLSGYIVEAGNSRPVSPRFGVYEYEEILKTFQQSGFVVISEARKKDPELDGYAAKVAEQINRLLKAGVPPRQITVVGASQGAWIAMLVSTYVKNGQVNFVLLAACSADDGFLKLVDLHGNILFISERTDLAASCQRFRADATGVAEYKEVMVNTGLAHGFLFKPMKEWVEPTLGWARR
jgi:hypothetical protein